MSEPNLLQPEPYSEIQRRLAKLLPSSRALWGEMDVAQMLAHLSVNLEMATSDQRVRQAFMGRIFGGMAKRQVMKKGMTRNIGTLASLKISDKREFRKEKNVLGHRLERFYQGGEAGITGEPHEFFGRMTTSEWARLQYVHIDHHFRQFGV